LSIAKRRPVILATCPAHRGREASRELQTLILEDLERETIGDEGASPATKEGTSLEAIQEEMQAEIRALQSPQAQPFQTVHTDCAGLLCAVFDDGWDVLALSQRIAQRIWAGETSIRYLAKLLPLQLTAHGDEASCSEMLLKLLSQHFGEANLVAEGVAAVQQKQQEKGEKQQQDKEEQQQQDKEEQQQEEQRQEEEQQDKQSEERQQDKQAEERQQQEKQQHEEEEKEKEEKPEKVDPTTEAEKQEEIVTQDLIDPSGIRYMVQFSHRHHAALNREVVRGIVRALLPPQHRVDYKEPDIFISVEAVKGVVGASLFRGGKSEYDALNLQKACNSAREAANAGSK